MVSNAKESVVTMDEVALRQLSRAQIQQLARRNNIKGNIKTDAIIRHLIEKHPQGVPTISSPTRPKRNMRKPVVNIRVKVKEEDKAFDGSNVLSSTMTQTPATVRQRVPSARSSLEDPGATLQEGLGRPLQAPSGFLTQPVFNTPVLPSSRTVDVSHEQVSSQSHHVCSHSPLQTPQPIHRPQISPRSPSPPYPTYHQTHEILRTLRKLIDNTSLDSESSTSIEYKTSALDQLLDEKVIPRLMKVDKDVKDLVWMRIALEKECISRFKEKGVLPDGYMHKKVYNVGGENLPAPKTNPMRTADIDKNRLNSRGNKRKRSLEDEADASDGVRSRSPSLNLQYPPPDDVSHNSKRSRVG